MNREDRIYIAKIKDILKEGRMTAYKDENKATSTEDNAYYQGLSEGYAHAYELVRKLKWYIILTVQNVFTVGNNLQGQQTRTNMRI